MTHKLPGLLLGAVLLVSFLWTEQAYCVVITWQGATTGDWFTATNWDLTAVPDNTTTQTYDVFVDGGNVQNSQVTVDNDATVDSLTIDPGDSVSVAADTTLEILGGLSGSVNTQTTTSLVQVTNGSINTVVNTGAGILSATDSNVSDVTNTSTLVLDNSTLGGLVSNNGTITFAGFGGGQIESTLLSGNGTLTGVGSTLLTDTLTIQDTQTVDDSAVLNWALGTVEIAGTLAASNSSILQMVGTNLVGTGGGGQLVADASSGFLLDTGSINNIILSGGGVLNISGGYSTVGDLTNNASTLVLSDAILTGQITNNGLTYLPATGKFATAGIDGIGTLSGGIQLDAQDAGSVLTISGQQVLNVAAPRINGGTVEVAAPLSMADSSVELYGTTMTGVGGLQPINMIGYSAISMYDGSTLSNLSLTGTGFVNAENSTIRDVDSTITLVLDNSTLGGLVSNNGTITFAGFGGGQIESTLLSGNGTLTGVGSTLLTDTLTIQDTQTVDDSAVLNWALGTVEIAGTLAASNSSILQMVGTNLVGTGGGGQLVADASSGFLLDTGSINNIILSGGGVLNISGGYSTVGDLTNNASTLVLSDAILTGQITNNGLTYLPATGKFATAGIDGIGTLSGGIQLDAQDAGSVLTISGQQVLNVAAPRINGGTVEVAAPLSMADSSVELYGTTMTGVGGLQPINMIGYSAISMYDGSTLSNLSLTGTGFVNASNSTISNVDNAVTIVLNNSTLENLIVNSGTILGQDLAIGTGTELNLDNGAVSGNITVQDGGILSGGGDITGDVMIMATGLAGGDGVSSMMNIYGDLLLDGLTQMEIGGTGLLDYDRYFIFDNMDTTNSEGLATLGGDLTISFLNAFMPTSGDFFDLFVADGLVDNAINITLLGLDPTLDFSTQFLSENGQEIFRLGIYTGSGPGDSSVPEPGSLVLLVIGLMAMGWSTGRLQRGRPVSWRR